MVTTEAQECGGLEATWGGVGHMGAGTRAQCAAGWWGLGEGGQAGGT